jgi:hypothetical protein
VGYVGSIAASAITGIVSHTSVTDSGVHPAVPRTARALDERAVGLAVVASVRHEDTD